MVEEIKGNVSKYDHDNPKLYEALGISKERMLEINKIMLDICCASGKKSHSAEKLEKALNRRELTLLATLFIWSQYEKICRGRPIEGMFIGTKEEFARFMMKCFGIDIDKNGREI